MSKSAVVKVAHTEDHEEEDADEDESMEEEDEDIRLDIIIQCDPSKSETRL